MKLKKLLLYRLLLAVPTLFLVHCASKNKNGDPRGVPDTYVSGSFLVGLVESDDKEKTKADFETKAGEIVTAQGCTPQPLEPMIYGEAGSPVAMDLADSYHYKLTDCELTREQTFAMMDDLLSLEEVETIEAEAEVSQSLIENDPGRSQQYYLGKINRDMACDIEAKQSSTPIVVAVVDSGVDRNHPDLVDSFYRDGSGRIVGANFVGKGSNRNPDSNWDDTNGHGTHVAGAIAATSNNSQGISGVAGCANIKIIPIRALGTGGTGSSIEIDRAIWWAAENGADIINLSLGFNSQTRSKKSSHSKNLFRELNKKGIMVFAAAGNDGLFNGSRSTYGYTYSYPASYDYVIAVAATNQNDRLTNFSNRGDHIDIAAPGASILSTYPSSTYQRLDGTSMASPIAAGAYALALSKVKAALPSYSKLHHDDILPLLMNSTAANRLSTTNVSSGGVIDSKKLATEMMAAFGGETTSPDNGSEDPVENPAPTSGFTFVNLQDGQTVRRATNISMKGWPSGTTRIYLFWADDPYSFTSLHRGGRSQDGQTVTSLDRYYLYGSGELTAIAVDFRGNSLGRSSINLNGL